MKCHTNIVASFRDDNGLTVVDITIASTHSMDPFNAAALEAQIEAALKEVVQDGKIGTYDVAAVGSVDVGSTTGMSTTSIMPTLKYLHQFKYLV